jgi:dTDP-4-dehydrorhamnose reductase
MQNAPAILVAGKTGQLARAITVLAEERKLPLFALGPPELDLGNVESVDQITVAKSPQAIVNAAAYTLVDKAESEPDLAFKINCDGAAHLARAAARLRIPFIHVSTDYVFDGTKTTAYQEDDSPSPLSAYGRSKRAGEVAVLDAHPGAIIIRTSWIYSPYGQNFVKTMLRLAETRECVRVVDDQHGAPTSAQDLAEAILEILKQIESTKVKSTGGIYHITAAGETTWYGFAAEIFAGWAKRKNIRIPILEPISTADYPTPARRPANSRLDCSKAAQIFGIHLPRWQQSLEICLGALAADNPDAT